MNNVVNLTHARMLRDIRNSRFLKVYKVKACPRTGEWKTAPKQTGEMVSSFIWSRQEDTSERHFTTFTPEPGKEETHALVVHWLH